MHIHNCRTGLAAATPKACTALNHLLPAAVCVPGAVVGAIHQRSVHAAPLAGAVIGVTLTAWLMCEPGGRLRSPLCACVL